MILINKDVLKLTAKKLMFEMDENEYDTLLKEFEIVLKQISFINEIPGLDDAEPMYFPYDIKTSYLREDVVEQPLDKKDVLKNSKHVKDGQIELPKVVK